jgi:hypothetical protein
MLAMRSIVIVSIVGVLSHLFIKYIVGVAKTVSPEESSQTHQTVHQEIDHGIDRNDK